MGEYFFTESGLARLKAEISKIENELKVDIPQALHKAAAHGDLRENGEYQAAKERQSYAMARRKELRERLKGAEIVRQPDFPADIVTLFKRVRIRDTTSGQEQEYSILGEGDADLDRGIISYATPLARALIGHRQGETVQVELPRGTVEYEILEFSFLPEA